MATDTHNPSPIDEREQRIGHLLLLWAGLEHSSQEEIDEFVSALERSSIPDACRDIRSSLPGGDTHCSGCWNQPELVDGAWRGHDEDCDRIGEPPDDTPADDEQRYYVAPHGSSDAQPDGDGRGFVVMDRTPSSIPAGSEPDENGHLAVYAAVDRGKADERAAALNEQER